MNAPASDFPWGLGIIRLAVQTHLSNQWHKVFFVLKSTYNHGISCNSVPLLVMPHSADEVHYCILWQQWNCKVVCYTVALSLLILSISLHSNIQIKCEYTVKLSSQFTSNKFIQATDLNSDNHIFASFFCTISAFIITSDHCIWHSEDRASWYILIIKPTRCTNFSNLFWYGTLHVSDSFSAHHQESSTEHTAMVYVTQVMLTAW